MPQRTWFGMMGLVLFAVVAAHGQYQRVTVPLEQLPQEHEYQRTLRQHLAALTEKDFQVEPREITLVPTDDPETQYRLWLLTRQNMENLFVARLPAASFTLAQIESKVSLCLPTEVHECTAPAWLASWDYPGNPYRGSRPLKLRAFVLAAVDTVMLDYLYEHAPQGAARSDYLGGNLIWIGYTYRWVKDILPAEVRAAFETGLRKHAARLREWGPTGLMTDMDLFAAVGLRFLHETIEDPEIRRQGADYARRLFTDPHFFHPAGYFVDMGCFDTSYNGISLYFASWAALMSDWDFAKEAVIKAHRLRAHLCFPDPDGSFTGPSHMSSRTSADPPHDQWQFQQRLLGAAMVTDEALWHAPFPDEQALRTAAARVVTDLNAQLAKPAEPASIPWREGHWGRTLNFAHEHYPAGFYARRLALQQQNSPLLKPVFQREERFIRAFEQAFVIAKLDGFGLAIHTGPVGRPAGYQGRPYGFGGGQLSVFWTPQSGSVIAGRRRGVQGHVWDKWEEWPNWPVHSVAGLTAAGDWVTSTRIAQPQVQYDLAEDHGQVLVAGPLPAFDKLNARLYDTGHLYQRRFAIGSDRLEITTTVGPDADPASTLISLGELYETIPLFLRENSGQTPAAIRVRVGGQWREASAEPLAAVEAVAVDRFDGTVTITFSEPRRLKLAPEIWTDGFQTQAQCRALLIDLPADGQGQRSVHYVIQPGRREP